MTVLAALFGRRRPPLSVLAVGGLVAAAAALPAAYLVIVIAGEWDTARDAIFDSRTLGLLGRSAGLAAAVTVAATAIAVPLAWLTVRSDLRFKRIWATLATLPLVIPSYIGAYLFVSALGPNGTLQGLLEPFGVERLPSLYGFPGAMIVLTLFTYPLVLIPARAALRRVDPQLEEAALAMGRPPLDVFRTVVLPQLMPAIAAGALLVSLYVMSDFGAVSITRFDSFTREIYVSYQSSFERTSAAALGAVLVVLMLVLLAVQARLTGSRALHRAGPGTQRPPREVQLGRWRWPAVAFCSIIVLVALAVPVGVLIYWATKGISSGIAFDSTIVNAGNSLLAAGAAALFGGLAALPIAVLAVRYPGLITRTVERLGYAGYVLPGIVVALALVFFATRAVLPLYQTLALLVFAYVIRFLPEAVGSLRSGLLQVNPRLEEAAASLGRQRHQVFLTITAPLIAPAALGGVALVFMSAVKELPVTLLLGPIGFKTLATATWTATASGLYAQAAPPALLLVLVSAASLPWLLRSDRGADPERAAD
jgi:iron(III) transport system permease protein